MKGAAGNGDWDAIAASRGANALRFGEPVPHKPLHKSPQSVYRISRLGVPADSNSAFLCRRAATCFAPDPFS